MLAINTCQRESYSKKATLFYTFPHSATLQGPLTGPFFIINTRKNTMATRQKRAPVQEIESDDPWRQVSEPLEMQNGVMAIHWRNQETNQTRIVPAGTHPDDQALESYTLQAPETQQEEETATDRVAALLQIAGGADRAEIKVYRMNAGQMEYCQGFKPTEFEDGNFDMLRDRFGAGDQYAGRRDPSH